MPMSTNTLRRSHALLVGSWLALVTPVWAQNAAPPQPKPAPTQGKAGDSASGTEAGKATEPTRVIRPAGLFGAEAVRGAQGPAAVTTPPAAKPAAAKPVTLAAKPAAPPPSTATAPGLNVQGAAGGGTDELPLPGAKEFSECQRYPRNKKVLINLKPDTELMELVGWIKSISCRPFILPSNIRQGKVTIIAPELVTAEEAYRIFLSALESMGMTVQPQGQVLKIIESNRARESSIPVYSPGDPVPRSEQFVTRLLRLKYITTEEVVQVLNRLKGRDGDIMPYATTNTLVITDLATNIKRMEEVVRALDVAMSGEKIWVLRLKNVVATEVAQMLEKVFNVGKTQQPGAKRAPINVPSSDGTSLPPAQVGTGDDSLSQILPDDRTNSLIIVSSERTYQRVFALVKRLEQQGASAEGGADRIHVYALENASAEDMKNVLGQLPGISAGVSSGSRGTAGRPRMSSTSSSSSSGSSGQGAGLFQDEVKIVDDKATNSLVIYATGKDYLVLRDVIRRLDVPRRQVFIEATVMEISLSKSRDLGLSYHGGIPLFDNKGLLVGGLKSGSLNSLSPLSLLTLPGLVGGVMGPQFSSTGIFSQTGTASGSIIPPQFGLILQALQTNNDVNILQVPNILTTDNEKSLIEIGQNLPFPSAITGGLPQLGAAGGLSNFAALQSVQRQNVTLKLEVTPHVNSGDFVRLEIKSTIDDVADKNFNGLGPATNKRTLETVAVVRDQQPVVLGGIMRDSVREAITKIPLLGDIPILGYLFKTRSKETQKQMLLIVLTPYVINDPADLARVFERKTRERREFIDAYASFSDDRDLNSPVDYTRRRGALEEINQTAVQAERELLELRAAEQSLNREVTDSGPVELPPNTRSGPSGSAGVSNSPSPTPQSPAPTSPSLPPPPAALNPGRPADGQAPSAPPPVIQ